MTTKQRNNPVRVPKSALRDFCQAAAATGLLDLDEALITGAGKGQTSVVQALIDGGADIHAATTASGLSNDEALILAAYNGHTETAKVLLAAGADVHADYESPLRGAAQGGHAETVRALLAAGADAHAEYMGLREEALLAAARGGHAETVKVLLAAGADQFSKALDAARQYSKSCHRSSQDPRAQEKTLIVLGNALQRNNSPGPEW